MAETVFVEPYDGGSHRILTRFLVERGLVHRTMTLPGRHWKWRMRGCAGHFAQAYASDPFDADHVIASSYVPVAELKGLCPPLASARWTLFFHENQLEYPVRDPTTKARDVQYGFTQLVSACAADTLAFNSAFNRDSFLAQSERLLKRMPDFNRWVDFKALERKSHILPIPVSLVEHSPSPLPRRDRPVLLWNHRWEFDKDPETFFEALFALDSEGVEFDLIVCGERTKRVPAIFDEAKERLSHRLLHFGYAPSRHAYVDLLRQADLVVSTAIHEFFGVSIVEAVACGAVPILPDRLSYRELFAPAYRYREGELVHALRHRLTQASSGQLPKLGPSEVSFAAPDRVFDAWHQLCTP